MKLRLRLLKLTKVVEISDGIVAETTIGDVAERVQPLFQENLFGEFELSLNNRDVLGRDLNIIHDCHVVSGDLIFILPKEEQVLSTDKQNKETTNKPQIFDVKSDASNPQLRLGEGAEDASTKSEHSDNTLSQDSHSCTVTNNLEQPGTSTEMETEQLGTMTDVSMEMDEEPVDITAVRHCLSEPVLCREATDGSVPALLQELYTAMQPTDVSEALCVVLHVLMLETGFTCTEVAGALNCQVPTSWKHGGYYKFSYTYTGCTDRTCCVTVLPTGSSVTVHGKVIGSNDVARQCQLKPREYVCSNNTDCLQCYSQLAKLSMLFKDSISNPLVHDIRTSAGLVDVFGLLALTQEVKLKILSFLDLKSLLEVCRVNTELCEIGRDPYLWRNLYLRHFGNRKDNCLSQDWKELYKREYKARKERRKMMNRMKIVLPPNWGPQNPFSGPSNWIPPVPGAGGIIGGDYDLYPNFPGSLPGVPGRLGPLLPNLPRPRYDLIGPGPSIDPGPDHLLPRQPGGFGRLGGRGGGGFMGFRPRFF